jgi:HD superfamily phosphohydrolase YqeK
MDRDLYDSKLDALDEVLFCRDVLSSLQQNNQPLYQFYFYQCLDGNDQQAFSQAVQAAEQYQQYIQSQHQVMQ